MRALLLAALGLAVALVGGARRPGALATAAAAAALGYGLARLGGRRAESRTARAAVEYMGVGNGLSIGVVVAMADGFPWGAGALAGIGTLAVMLDGWRLPLAAPPVPPSSAAPARAAACFAAGNLVAVGAMLAVLYLAISAGDVPGGLGGPGDARWLVVATALAISAALAGHLLAMRVARRLPVAWWALPAASAIGAGVIAMVLLIVVQLLVPLHEQPLGGAAAGALAGLVGTLLAGLRQPSRGEGPVGAPTLVEG